MIQLVFGSSRELTRNDVLALPLYLEFFKSQQEYVSKLCFTKSYVIRKVYERE